jgi:hypothetical protein
MLRRLRNAFISFSVISQEFPRWNPKCKGGNVKGVGWLHGFGCKWHLG